MILSAITAVAENNVIGIHNELPWRLPADMKYFKNVTMGHVVIMGRKTYESFGKALPGRTSIVVTRQKDYVLADATVVHSLEAAIDKSRSSGEEEAFVIGGAEIYKQSMNVLDKLYLTRIHADFEGDAFFPELDKERWKLVKNEVHEADEKNPYNYSFQVWEAVKAF